MRQVCNIAWVAQVEGMDEGEYKKFVRELPVDPTVKVSHGVSDLMAMLRRGPRG